MVSAANLRIARSYASDTVASMLRAIAASPTPGVILDIDALERSALARIDRIMVLALTELAQTDTRIILAARRARPRAMEVGHLLQPAPLLLDASASCLADAHAATPGCRFVVISDNPDLLTMITTDDRALALGRPELAGPLTAVIGDSSVRASLWFLAHERLRNR